MAKNSSLLNLHRLINESAGGAPIPVSFLGDLRRSVEMEDKDYNNHEYDKSLVLEKIEQLLIDCKEDNNELSRFIILSKSIDMEGFEEYLKNNPSKTDYFQDCQRVPSNCYKPSSMNCIRNMYFQRTNASKDESKESAERTRIAESGTAAHEYIQKHVIKMKKHGMECEYIDVETFIRMKGLDYLVVVGKRGIETKLYDTRYNMRFMCDGIIRYKGRYYVLEIKTEVSNKFMARDNVEPEHHTQACAYSLALNIPGVIFLYESRDFCSWKCYLFEVTNPMKEELVINKIKECDSYVEKQQVPPLPIDAGKKLCRYCDFKTICKVNS